MALIPKLNVEGSSPFGRSTYDRSPSDVSGPVSSACTGQSKAVPPGARGAANADEDLDRVCSAWPELPVHIRAAVLTLVQAAED